MADYSLVVFLHHFPCNNNNRHLVPAVPCIAAAVPCIAGGYTASSNSTNMYTIMGVIELQTPVYCLQCGVIWQSQT